MPSEHNLRPALTQELFKRLTQGATINLIATPEQGSKRLLKDLYHFAFMDQVFSQEKEVMDLIISGNFIMI